MIYIYIYIYVYNHVTYLGLDRIFVWLILGTGVFIKPVPNGIGLACVQLVLSLRFELSLLFFTLIAHRHRACSNLFYNHVHFLLEITFTKILCENQGLLFFGLVVCKKQNDPTLILHSCLTQLWSLYISRKECNIDDKKNIDWVSYQNKLSRQLALKIRVPRPLGTWQKISI